MSVRPFLGSCVRVKTHFGLDAAAVLRGAALLGALAGLAAPASAYLGSFNNFDGYHISVPSGSVNWSDVSYYNAGAYGPNAGGGGGPTLATPNSGKWSIVSQAGGFFSTSAARAAAIAGSPPYPSSLPPGTLPIYIVGDHFPGRGGDGANLAVRNDSPAGTGALEYDYALDSYDFGGPTPSSVTSGPVSTRFYHMPNPSVPTVPGTRPQDKFQLTFRDSLGNVGLQWGYAMDNEVYWRTSPSGPWTYTGIYADAGNWDGVRVDIDLTGDTFKLDYYDISASTWLNLAPAGTPLGQTMTDLTYLRWTMEGDVHGGVGGKNFFDDFHFVVPEPSTVSLVALSLLALRRRRS